MKNSTKGWLIAAAVLVVLGLITAGIAAAAAGGNFSALGKGKLTETTVDVSGSFNNISIESDTEAIEFVHADDGKCRVVFCVPENRSVSAEVEADTLVVKTRNEGKWYQNISLFTIGSSKITVYLPENQFARLDIDEDTGKITVPGVFGFESADIKATTGDVSFEANVSGSLNITTDTGDINCEGMEAGSLELEVDTGRVTLTSLTCAERIRISVDTGRAMLTNVTCGSFLSTGDTGSITLENVIAEGRMEIRRDTGSVKFVGCDAEEIEVSTDTGSVTGSLLTEKVFIAKSDTGKVDVPETASGGKCKITTDTGSIKITIG